MNRFDGKPPAFPKNASEIFDRNLLVLWTFLRFWAEVIFRVFCQDAFQLQLHLQPWLAKMALVSSSECPVAPCPTGDLTWLLMSSPDIVLAYWMIGCGGNGLCMVVATDPYSLSVSIGG